MVYTSLLFDGDLIRNGFNKKDPHLIVKMKRKITCIQARDMMAIYGQEFGLKDASSLLGFSRSHIRYWTQKYKDITFHPDT